MTNSPSPSVDEVGSEDADTLLIYLRGSLSRVGKDGFVEVPRTYLDRAIELLAASLVSPPKAGSGKPVAWRWRAKVKGEWGLWSTVEMDPNDWTWREYWEDLQVQPLYANHEARGDGVRVKPLSLESFAADFNAAMERTGVTVRGLAEELGVDKSAISRVRTGKQVTQSNFIAMLNWLNALEAALPPLGGDGRAEIVETGWRDISTAKQDHREPDILLYHHHYDQAGRLVEYHTIGRWVVGTGPSASVDGWEGHEGVHPNGFFTHWKPLTSPAGVEAALSLEQGEKP